MEILLNLFFIAIIILLTVGLIALFVKASSAWNRSWAAFLIIAIFAGTLSMLAYPVVGAGVTFAIWLPMVILAIVLGGWMSWHSYRHHQGQFQLSERAEPRYTQEEMLGLAGTRNALAAYLGLLLIVFGAVFLIRFLFSLTNY